MHPAPAVSGAVLLALAFFYAGLMVRYARGLRRVLARTLPPLPPDPPLVSVVVPARDEAEHLDACVRSVLDNEYPARCFEVIVVDDFSRDETAAVVRAVQAEAGRDRVRVLRLADRVPDEADGHKGAALAWGIHEAGGRLILTTDADCTVEPGWIEGMVRAFRSARVGFVAGPVRMEPGRGLFGRFQALEFAGLVGVGAGALGAGVPNMCNSASVAYPRRVFEAMRVVIDEESPSPWDDELMLQRIAAHPTLEAAFTPLPDAVVTTHAERSWAAFWRQRRRWAATGARYPNRPLVASLRLVWAFYAALLASAGLAFVWAGFWPFVTAAFVVKVAAEALVLVPITRHLGQSRLLVWFLPEQLLQVPYVVAVGLAGALGRPEWKGRRFEPA